MDKVVFAGRGIWNGCLLFKVQNLNVISKFDLVW